MRARFVLVLALSLLFSACAAREEGLPASDAMAEPMEAAAPEAGRALATEQMANPTPSATPPPAIQNRKIIYTADLTVQVKQLDPAVAKARELIEQAGGYVSNLQQSGGSLSRYATLTLRVPVERFEELVGGLAAMGTVTDKSISTDDVTEQWVDIDARLRNLKREEERYLAILQQANKVTDLLEIERELARVRGEIEQTEAQFRALQDRVALSTITLTLQLPPEVEASAESGSWFAEVGGNAAALFVNFAKFLGALLIYLVALAPFWGGLWLLIWWIRRRRRLRR